jgi:hypothetical protein
LVNSQPNLNSEAVQSASDRRAGQRLVEEPPNERVSKDAIARFGGLIQAK